MKASAGSSSNAEAAVSTAALLAALSGDVVHAGKTLIGARLVRIYPDGRRATVRIIETEAYHESEPGSHSYRGMTERNRTMFLEAGRAYVYLIYGMYHCLNVVAGRAGEGAAVLIRAAEYAATESNYAENEGSGADAGTRQCALSGPGKLCRELRITRLENGIHLFDQANGKLLLVTQDGDRPIVAESTRIGLSRGDRIPWRFYEKDNPRVSRIKRLSKKT